MTDDIVTRLRSEVCECGYAASFNELHKCLWCESADEIERLRFLLGQFISACKIDDFGHIYDVDFGDLTQAYKNSIEVLK